MAIRITNKSQPNLTRVVLLALTLLVSGEAALAQGTAFTYQGKLVDNGTPANGNYDMQFKLFDMPTAGSQQASLTNSSVTVTNGGFTVQLDFGVCATCFDGSARFLEIGVRPSGSPNAYAVLAPRQPVTSNPYSIRSMNAATADNATQLNGMPAGGFIQNTTTQQAGTNFNIGGNGTLGGTISANTVNTTTQYNIGGSRVLSVAGTNNAFMGITAGRDNTTGSLNSFFGAGAGNTNTEGFKNSFFGNFAGALNTTGSHNSFFGNQAGQNNTVSDNSFFGAFAGFTNATGTGNAFVGRNAGFNSTGSNDTAIGAFADLSAGVANGTAVGANAQVTQSNSLVLGSINGVNGAVANTNVGIGTTAPISKLQVVTTNDTSPGTITAWDSRHVVIGGAASSGGIGLSYDQTNNVGYIEALSPNAFWRNLILQSGGGNVGIGTTSPSTKLHIAGSALVYPSSGNGSLNIQNRTNTNYSQVVFVDDTGVYRGYTGYIGANGGLGPRNDTFEVGSNNKDITFRPSETETMRLTPNSVKAGSASSGSNFVQDAPNGWRDAYRIFRGGNQVASIGMDSTGSKMQLFVGPTSNDSTSQVSIDDGFVDIDGGLGVSGNLDVIGTSTLQGPLQVTGTLQLDQLGPSTAFNLCWAGQTHLISSCFSSSKRYKDDILSFNPGLEVISRLRPVTFNWKSTGEKDLGLIAEEVHEVNPLLTLYNDKGQIEGVKYDRLNVVLINAIKQQQRQIESQRQQNAEMKARLTMLENIMQKISKSSRRRGHKSLRGRSYIGAP